MPASVLLMVLAIALMTFLARLRVAVFLAVRFSLLFLAVFVLLRAFPLFLALFLLPLFTLFGFLFALLLVLFVFFLTLFALLLDFARRNIDIASCMDGQPSAGILFILFADCVLR